MAENFYINRKRAVITCAFLVNVGFVILFVIWSLQYFTRYDQNANYKPLLSNGNEFDEYLRRFVLTAKD